MKNVKKLLALVLALVMSLSLATIGANAVLDDEGDGDVQILVVSNTTTLNSTTTYDSITVKNGGDLIIGKNAKVTTGNFTAEAGSSVTFIRTSASALKATGEVSIQTADVVGNNANTSSFDASAATKVTVADAAKTAVKAVANSATDTKIDASGSGANEDETVTYDVTVKTEGTIPATVSGFSVIYTDKDGELQTANEIGTFTVEKDSKVDVLVEGTIGSTDIVTYSVTKEAGTTSAADEATVKNVTIDEDGMVLTVKFEKKVGVTVTFKNFTAANLASIKFAGGSGESITGLSPSNPLSFSTNATGSAIVSGMAIEITGKDDANNNDVKKGSTYIDADNDLFVAVTDGTGNSGVLTLTIPAGIRELEIDAEKIVKVRGIKAADGVTIDKACKTGTTTSVEALVVKDGYTYYTQDVVDFYVSTTTTDHAIYIGKAAVDAGAATSATNAEKAAAAKAVAANGVDGTKTESKKLTIATDADSYVIYPAVKVGQAKDGTVKLAIEGDSAATFSAAAQYVKVGAKVELSLNAATDGSSIVAFATGKSVADSKLATTSWAKISEDIPAGLAAGSQVNFDSTMDVWTTDDGTGAAVQDAHLTDGTASKLTSGQYVLGTAYVRAVIKQTGDPKANVVTDVLNVVSMRKIAIDNGTTNYSAINLNATSNQVKAIQRSSKSVDLNLIGMTEVTLTGQTGMTAAVDNEVVMTTANTSTHYLYVTPGTSVTVTAKNGNGILTLTDGTDATVTEDTDAETSITFTVGAKLAAVAYAQ